MGLDALLIEPGTQRQGNELGAVVAADESWRPIFGKDLRQHLDHLDRTKRARHPDGQALTGELIHDRQTAQLAAVHRGILEKIIGKHMPRVGGLQRDRLGGRSASPMPAAGWHLQLSRLPEPLHTLVVDGQTLLAQRAIGAPITGTLFLLGKVAQQHYNLLIVIRPLGIRCARAADLGERATAALGQAGGHQLVDHVTTFRGAQTFFPSTALSASTSRSRSASSFLRRVFSSARRLSSLASLTVMP